MTLGEKLFVISWFLMPIILLLIYPFWLSYFKNLPLQDFPIGSFTKEQTEKRLTKQLLQFKKIDKYLSVIVPVYISMMIILLFITFQNGIYGFWIIFTAISSSLALGLMIMNKIIIGTHEIILERYGGLQISSHRDNRVGGG